MLSNYKKVRLKLRFTFYNKYMPYEITEEVKQKFKLSKKIKRIKNKPLTKLFNNSAMGRVLDIFIRYPDVDIYTIDLLRATGGMSRNALYGTIPKLVEKGMVLEARFGPYKFFKWNGENEAAKYLEKFHHML